MRKSGYRFTCQALLAVAVALGVGACGLFGPEITPPTPQTPPVPQDITALDQGMNWSQAWRAAFYVQDQGSRIMPLAWFKALRLSDNMPLAADGLARFGYLSNPNSSLGLPVGFTTGSWQKRTYVGMTCAACHTRQIRVGGNYYRIDGGPALVDLQSLFAEIDNAVQRVLVSNATFATFAADVLGDKASPAAATQLRADVAAWAGPYHTLIVKALPQPPSQGWGVSRADAVGMILNRLGGLDLGATPDHVIATNIQMADAPARYPFLWNAMVQDKTQWPGFAPNGNDLFGLVRNLGEVYGVFGVFHPQPQAGWVGGLNYVDPDTANSANFQGLDAVEQMARRIGPPAWPWAINKNVRNQGEVLFNKPDRNGQSCVSCHGIVSQSPPLLPTTWRTPLIDVGTDRHEYDTLGWQGESGILEGSRVLLDSMRIQRRDSLVTMLTTATAGAIFQKAGIGHDPFSPSLSLITKDPAKNQSLIATSMAAPPSATASFVYESRVLQGIWAAAPYLHNGSVPTLADLLEPCDKRPSSFKVGIDYDVEKVGIARDQTGPVTSTTQTTSDDASRGSGNYRCGHEQVGGGFGTTFRPDEKKALLEYLKSL